jgi:hypothetical protein
MTAYPPEDGLEATEIPPTPGSALDPEYGTDVAPGPEADAPDAGGDAGPANSDPGDD